MNLPNKLTVSRIVLTFIFMFFLFLSQGQTGLLSMIGPEDKTVIFGFLALVTFGLAALTDFYDGRIARRRNIVTDFGKFMDPVADKILILAPFLAFVELKLIPAWMVVVIVSREVTITSLRLLAMGKGQILAATKGGKHKTIWQFIGVFVILSFLFLKGLYLKLFNVWDLELDYWFHIVIFYLMFLVVVLTLLSGIMFLWHNRFVFGNPPEGPKK